MAVEGRAGDAKDVLQLDDATARDVRRWAIRVLVEGARRKPGKADQKA